MNKPRISVIVPVYKTERYLQECIDSILAQTFRNFELILVNDGSPDSCGAICEAAAKSDARIRVLHQENQGVTRARANGVAAAKGDFITFVDSDDTIPPQALDVLVKHANDVTDIILGNAQHLGSGSVPPGEISLTEYRQMCVVMKTVHNAPFSKLFRRSLFNDWVFDMPRELKVGEDAIMNIRLAYRAKGKIYNTGAVVYNYRTNDESVTHVLSPSPEMDMLLAKYRLASFPAEDLQQHVEAGLYKSLISHWLNAMHQTPQLPPSVHEYHRFLLSIKDISGYRFSLYSYLLFHCTNQFVLNFFIKTCKLFKWLKGKIINS